MKIILFFIILIFAYFLLNIECAYGQCDWCSFNILDLYSRGTWPGYQLSWLVFFSFSRWMLG